MGATSHAFASALQGVEVAGVVVKSLPTLPILRLYFACRVAGYRDLLPIWEAVARGKDRTEGLATLNQTLMREIPYC